MMRKRDADHVIFGPVPKSSHVYIKSNVPDTETKKLEYYTHLLQLTVRSSALILDLEATDDAHEVAFLQNLGQFIDADKFVNTGFNTTVSYEEYDEEGDRQIIRPRVKHNEIMNLCFEYKSTRWATESELDAKAEVSGMVFRTYSELDLYELEEINAQLKESSGKLPEIDPEAILSVYEGRTIFSIYFDQIQVYEQLHSQLTENEYEPEENYQGVEIESSYLRRLL